MLLTQGHALTHIDYGTRDALLKTCEAHVADEDEILEPTVIFCLPLERQELASAGVVKVSGIKTEMEVI